MIQHIFERYALLKKPLHSQHMDTIRRLALVWKRLKEDEESGGSHE